MRYTEKLSRFALWMFYLAIAFFALKYFGSVIGYIVLSMIVALIAKPLVKWLRKIFFFGRNVPDSILSIFSILFILMILVALAAGLVPVFTKVVRNLAFHSNHSSIEGLSIYLSRLNMSLRDIFKLAPDFKLEIEAMEKLSSIMDITVFGNVIGTVAYTIGEIAIGIFSVVFISFFLIKDETMVPRLINAITPERHIEHINSTISDVEHLLSRYFVGLIIEMFCVGMIDFLGLWFVARLDFDMALGIGFMAGILNIIPYLGPLIGGVIGSVMAIALKFSGLGAAPNVSFWMFVIMVAAVFCIAQLVDNMLLQPIIYSTSVQAHPLEIFIVLLLAGSVAGILGMILAIPAYTVVRVVCINFFPDLKFVKFLKKKS